MKTGRQCFFNQDRAFFLFGGCLYVFIHQEKLFEELYTEIDLMLPILEYCLAGKKDLKKDLNFSERTHVLIRADWILYCLKTTWTSAWISRR